MKLQIQSSLGKNREVTGNLVTVDIKNRWKRSAQFGGMGLGLAVLCLPLPAVHFVLVPSCLLAAVYLGNQKLNEKFMAEFKNALCPECGKALKDSKIFSRKPRFQLQCYECKTHLNLHSLPSAATENQSADHS